MAEGWDSIRSQCSPSQRRGLYRFLAGVDSREVKDLLRHLTSDEASAMLDALIRADNRRVSKLPEPEDDLIDAILLG